MASDELSSGAMRVMGRQLLSLRQIESCYWSGHLGSFVAAARRLNTTQSSISKRIQELEQALGIQVFDRSRRAIRLTPKGEEVVRLCERLLLAHMDLANIAHAEAVIAGKFRFGVTETVSNTWLPEFLAAVRRENPAIVPELHVGTSQEIRAALLKREIDLAIGGDIGGAPDLTVVRLAQVEQIAIAAPEFGLSGRPVALQELAPLPLIGPRFQSDRHLMIEKAFHDCQLVPNIIAFCASPFVRVRLATARLGIAFVPMDPFIKDLDLGHIGIVETGIGLPAEHYVAAYRNDIVSPAAARLADIARRHCAFLIRDRRLSPPRPPA